MQNAGTAGDGIEKLVGDLSSYLVSTLNALGYQKHGLEKDDLLQEIHIRIWRVYKDNFRNIQYFNAYLKKIIYSVFINELNRVNKQREVMEAGKVCLDAAIGSNGYGVAEGESAGSILVDTIDDLNESKQRVIKLRLEGFSFGEIARLNHWTYRKTCNIFYRGVKDLKQELGKKGIQYED